MLEFVAVWRWIWAFLGQMKSLILSPTFGSFPLLLSFLHLVHNVYRPAIVVVMESLRMYHTGKMMTVKEAGLKLVLTSVVMGHGVIVLNKRGEIQIRYKKNGFCN